MQKTLAAVAVAFAMTGGAFASHSAFAQAVSFDVGNVAIGYSDGYWDHGHAWHTWSRPEDSTAYRAAKGAEYHEWKHDRDKDMGWHSR
jgi:hypothetical protein